MKVVHERNLNVNSTWTDINCEMGLMPSLQVVQDNMCEFFRLIGSDGITMIPVCNAFLVLTKTRIHFENFIKWLDEFVAISEVSAMSRIKVCLDAILKDKNNNILATCSQELCAMDNDTRKIRFLETTLVPTDLEVTKSKSLDFAKMSFEMSDEDLVDTIDIKVVNLDFYKHTNNLEYVRMMMSLLDLKFLEDNIITDFEIHYISESRFGDKLSLYKRVEDNKILFEIKREDKVVTKAILEFIAR